MSDEEEESISEGFSPSGDEWLPGAEAGRGGESSDDDDSDFEEVPTGSRSGRSSATNLIKKDSRLSGVLAQHSGVKKRKPAGQSLRAKLYNKYRPPPKSLPSPSSGKNSPSASTSKGKSKNLQTPNEADNSDSDGSIDNYLVNPEEVDLRSNFYQNLHVSKDRDVSPVFDCNAGIKDMSDSDSEDNNESSHEEHVSGTKYNFAALLDNAKSFERIQLDVSKNKSLHVKTDTSTTAMEVSALLALGESNLKMLADKEKETAPKLSKTKSTRVKRHTKTRPTSTVDADDSEDSEFEEVADKMHSTMLPESSLEVEVELGQRRRKEQKKQTKEELELSLRRKFNRNLKDRQLLIHKASLLSQFGRSHYYNLLLNDRAIMEKVLPLLPSQNAYPPQSGTEIKYFTSLTTWFKTTIKLMDSRMYPDHPRKKLKRKYLKKHLIEQIQKKQACCKQDMIFIYVALLRAMGLQCRLVVNLQPLPMKLDKSDLLPLKLTETKKKGKTKPTVEKDTEMSYSEDESLNNIKNGKKVHFNPVEKEKVLTVQEEKRITRNRKPLNLQDKVEKTKEDSENVPQKQPNKRTRKNDENIKNNKKEGTDKNKLNAENEPVKGNIELKPFSIRLNRILKDKQNINISETGKSTVLGEPKPELRRLPTRSVSRKRANVPTEQNVESKKSKSQGKIKLELGENPVRITRQRVKNPATKIPQLDGAADEIQAHKKGRTQSKRLQLKTLNKTRSKEESDDDFQVSPAKKPKAPKTEKKSPRAVLSSEDEDLSQQTKSSKKEKNTTDIWVEVWSDKEERWVCIDIFSGKVDSVDAIRKSASNSLAYVFAFQKDLSIKDVTARYCVNWGNVVRISRVDGAWLNTALAKRVPKKTKQDLVEDQELRRIHEEKPLPTSICEYKNHPLYALERHLLQFQALYPPNPPTLGFIRNEPVYPRDCVHLLHSREIWHKDARVVKPGEEPYKIVRRPKWDRINRTILKDQPLEVFGYWQTQKFEPPVAENGIVPRNEYGNVELFKKCMLPKKCVHLRLPGLQRICKKLRIDCANALVGFDFHKGGVHAKYDGFVVCEEFKDTLVEAWNEEQLLIEEKEREKYEARVYGNWKKLIKGLLIKERLKIKYKF